MWCVSDTVQNCPLLWSDKGLVKSFQSTYLPAFEVELLKPTDTQFVMLGLTYISSSYQVLGRSAKTWAEANYDYFNDQKNEETFLYKENSKDLPYLTKQNKSQKEVLLLPTKLSKSK